MIVTSSKECYCYTCKKSFHYLGISRHRAMHRDRKENCKIRYSDGSVYEYGYSYYKEDKE